MRKLNIILLAFVITIGAMFWAFWRGLQTEYVASYVSNRVSVFISKYISSDLQFERLSFDLFPPAINIHHLKFVSESSKIKELEFDIGELQLSVGFLDFFSSHPTISRVSLNETVIQVNESKLSEEYKKGDSVYSYLETKINSLPDTPDSDFIKRLKEIPRVEELRMMLIKEFPVIVQAVSINDFYIKRSNDHIGIKNFDAILSDTNIDVRFRFENLDLMPLTNKKFPLLINEVHGGLRYFKDKIRINSLGVRAGLNHVLLHGNLLNISPNLEKITADGTLNGMLSLTDVSEFSGIHDVLGVTKGQAELKGKISGFLKDITLVTDTLIHEFDSSVAYAKKVQAEVSFNKNLIKINKGYLKDENQYLALNKPFELYNLTIDKMVSTPIDVSAKFIKTDNMFRSIWSFMHPLGGELSGRLTVEHQNKNFIFKTQSELELKDFKLAFPSKTTGKEAKILSNPNLKIPRATFTYQYNIGNFVVDSEVRTHTSQLIAKGDINKDSVSIHSSVAKIKLEEFGPVAGIALAGAADVKFSAEGPLDDVHFILDGPINQFKFIDFNFGDINSKIELGLKDFFMEVTNGVGKHEGTEYSAKGMLDLNTFDINFDVNFAKTNYADTLKIYWPLLKDLKYLPKEVLGDFKNKFKITGKADPDKMIVHGEAVSKRLTYLQEDFKSLSISYVYQDSILNVNNINLIKESGGLVGHYTYNKNNGDYWFDGNFNQVSLDEFSHYRNLPFKMNGYLWGHLEGGKKDGKIDYNGNANIKKTSVDNEKLDDSKLVFDLNEDILTFELKLLGNFINGNGVIDFAQSPNESSHKSLVNLDVRTARPNVILNAFIGKTLNTNYLDGFLSAKVNSNFNLNRLDELSTTLLVEDAHFSIAHKRINLVSGANQIAINSGNLENVNLKFSGDQNEFSINGNGNFRNNFFLTGVLNFDAVLLESMFKGIIASSGSIINQFKVYGNSNSTNYELISKSSNLFLHHEEIPTIFNNINYLVNADEERLTIEHLDANLTSGTMRVLGDIYWGQSHKVNLTYLLENAGFNYLGKTAVTATGRGEITGDNKPYLVSGDINVVRASIQNELEDFGSSDKFNKENLKYLPLKRGQKKEQLVRFNVNLDATNPIYVKNSMAELNFLGATVLKGTPDSPKMGGRLNIVSGSSRFFFKSNDFMLSRGSVIFNENEVDINPELDFLASSTLAEYTIHMRIFGKAKNVNVELSSEPALSQVDILSLITLGYTNDLSQNLGASEKTAAASAGLGGLLFDRFKINEGLKNSLGVKLSLSSEFREGAAGGNMLKGRGSSSTGSSGNNVRSGTKVELRKKVSEAVDLSVSSTVGSSIGQRQSMNLNYNFNKVMAAEGVYEVRTNDEGVEDVVATSLGGDLKFKWTFK